VHKALADIASDDENGFLPENIEYAAIIVITDGFDDASGAPELQKTVNTFPSGLQLARKTRMDLGEYNNFLTDKIQNYKIKNKNLDVFAYGVRDAQETELNYIATRNENIVIAETPQDPNFTQAISDLQTNIINRVNNAVNQYELTATFSRPYSGGYTYRFFIDDEHWIDAKISFDEDTGKYNFDSINSNPEDYYIEGTEFMPEGEEAFSCSFRISYMDKPKSGQLIRISETGTTQIIKESEVSTHTATIQDKRSALVYFVLDSSMSMDVGDISTISNMVTGILDGF
jgi:hypothetical protein